MISVVALLNVERFWHGVEPGLEARWADSRVVAGGERSIVHRNAEVAYLGICDDLTWRLGGGQESSDEFVGEVPDQDRLFRSCHSPEAQLRHRSWRRPSHRTRWIAEERGADAPFTQRCPLGRWRP